MAKKILPSHRKCRGQKQPAHINSQKVKTKLSQKDSIETTRVQLKKNNLKRSRIKSEKILSRPSIGPTADRIDYESQSEFGFPPPQLGQRGTWRRGHIRGSGYLDTLDQQS